MDDDVTFLIWMGCFAAYVFVGIGAIANAFTRGLCLTGVQELIYGALWPITFTPHVWRELLAVIGQDNPKPAMTAITVAPAKPSCPHCKATLRTEGQRYCQQCGEQLQPKMTTVSTPAAYFEAGRKVMREARERATT